MKQIPGEKKGQWRKWYTTAPTTNCLKETVIQKYPVLAHIKTIFNYMSLKNEISSSDHGG